MIYIYLTESGEVCMELRDEQSSRQPSPEQPLVLVNFGPKPDQFYSYPCSAHYYELFHDALLKIPGRRISVTSDLARWPGNLLLQQAFQDKAVAILLSMADENAKSGDILSRETLQLYELAAHLGNIEAHFHVGRINFCHAQNAQEDSLKASYLRRAVIAYQVAAAQNHAPALLALASLYRSGEGVSRDPQQEIAMLQLAVNQNSPDAQYCLGCHYRYGYRVGSSDVVLPNADEARRLLLLAAEQNHPSAIYALGVMYLRGEGVPKNDGQGMAYLQSAIEKGHPGAKFYLEARCQYYAKIRGEFPDIANSFKWEEAKQYADWSDDADLQYILGYLLYNKKMGGTPDEAARAAACYQLAVLQGHGEAQFMLGIMRSNGVGVQKDPAEAIRLLESAGNRGYAKAYFHLGLMCETREARDGGEEERRQNYKEAAEYYRKAADLGHRRAAFFLGMMHRDGRGVKKSTRHAAKRLQSAAEKGNKAAAQELLTQLFQDEAKEEEGRRAAKRLRVAAASASPASASPAPVLSPTASPIPPISPAYTPSVPTSPYKPPISLPLAPTPPISTSPRPPTPMPLTSTLFAPQPAIAQQPAADFIPLVLSK